MKNIAVEDVVVMNDMVVVGLDVTPLDVEFKEFAGVKVDVLCEEEVVLNSEVALRL